MIVLTELTLRQINTSLLDLDRRILEKDGSTAAISSVGNLTLEEINAAIQEISDKIDALP